MSRAVNLVVLYLFLSSAGRQLRVHFYEAVLRPQLFNYFALYVYLADSQMGRRPYLVGFVLCTVILTWGASHLSYHSRRCCYLLHSRHGFLPPVFDAFYVHHDSGTYPFQCTTNFRPLLRAQLHWLLSLLFVMFNP